MEGGWGDFKGGWKGCEWWAGLNEEVKDVERWVVGMMRGGGRDCVEDVEVIGFGFVIFDKGLVVTYDVSPTGIAYSVCPL